MRQEYLKSGKEGRERKGEEGGKGKEGGKEREEKVYLP